MKTYIVGGAVRDMLMGAESKDIDYVVVGSTHDEMIAAGFKQVGADFPVYLSDDGTEYALARTERKNGKGYNGFITDHSPKVTLKEDLKRRDLTINAIAMDADGTIIDPYNGASHIKQHVLKHVSKAFAEDPVRVLRLARFRARYGAWKIHPGTMKLCKQMVADGALNDLTKERVIKELEKALGENNPYYFFKTLEMFGAIETIFKGYLRSSSNLIYHLIGNAQAVKLVYARLAYAFINIEGFEDEFKISNDWRRYRLMYSAFIGEHPTQVDRLYAMGAYRDKELFIELVRDMCLANDETKFVMWRTIEAWDKTHTIGFGDLSEEQQAALKGPAIAEAIKAKRMEVANAN